ncbi:DUF2303 family protein [uncultured Halomonas sp.]|uniref:DUF2303 family protein n=1 Tax=uncultured Halomonas sp. TaxID=173971 RepID=UPI0026111101|nr:DUF2303 family protein [uncultured Halomonas sp.]
MSLTKEALQHIEQSHKTGTEVAGGSALILGQEFGLADLEKYQDGRRRFRGKFATKGLADFTRYLSQCAEEHTPVFIDRDQMAARCYLDIGCLGAPGHCDHVATLTLPKTPEFVAFRRANTTTFDQEEMVELLEDWGHLMTFANSKGEALELRKVIHAFRKVSIEDLTSIDSEKQEHSSQVGVMNKVTVKNADRLPAVIAWRFSPYEGLQERELAMRVSSLTKGGPSFRLRAMGLDAAEQEIAEEFAKKIGEALPELECLQGEFTP